MKKERDIRLYLDDILEAIGKIEKYTEGLDFEQFRKDEKTGDAVIRRGISYSGGAGILNEGELPKLPGDWVWKRLGI